VLRPSEQTLPLVVASPHSGRDYPEPFVAASRLDPHTLRRSEDCYVDELFAGSVTAGAPMIRALFPRAYVDANREPFELDPRMFEDALPNYVTTRSPRITAGLGTVARIVASGCEIYGDKLRFPEVLRRITTHHHPYHQTLHRLVAATRARFGECALIDAHSMPSAGAGGDWEVGTGRVDFVLGDCHGLSCERGLTDVVEATLRDLGYTVARNEPYPGGYTTRHYGRPRDRVHAIQIEVNRSLYMDEGTLERTPYFRILAAHLGEVVTRVGDAVRTGVFTR
jgi:N-formylglutamate amidohydrolase